MASGTMWRSVTCSTCTATPPSRSSDCKCKTQVESVQQAHPARLAVSYGPQQFWDSTDDDWENIAGDHEERDRSVFGAMPTVEEVEEASSDLQNALRLGYLTPPLPAPYENAQASPEAPSSAVLEAIHEFQHNPEARDIVVSLATDKRIWNAVMANAKIKEFCRKFSAHTSEGAPNGAEKEKVKGPRKNVSFFSHLYWFTKQAFANFIASLQSFMERLFESADKKGPGMSDDGKRSFLDRMMRAFTRLAMFILSFVTFKRSAA